MRKTGATRINLAFEGPEKGFSHSLGQLRKSTGPPGRSAAGGEADEIGAKADIADGMSEAGCKAVVPAAWPELRLLAKSRLSQLRNSDRNSAHREAGGGSRPPHQAQLTGVAPDLAADKAPTRCAW